MKFADHEEEHYRKDPKEGRRERKRISTKDRSKYKKTDQEKSKEVPVMPEGALRGRVLSLLPEGASVDCEGQTYFCVLRGALKKEKTLQKNLLTVGDFVRFEETSALEGAIFFVEPRKSILSRSDPLSQIKEQYIAANIDQVLITVSVVDPPLKAPIVDRYIIAAQKGGMEPIIVINKIDLLEGAETPESIIYAEFCKAYAEAGFTVVPVSAETGAGLEHLREVMHDKASVFSGHSGAGKSPLINAMTGTTLKVGRTVGRTKKGAHTTTKAHLVPLEFGGWCIDTPGIKSFGVWDLKAEEIADYFPEIHEIGQECKYLDCQHLHEENCAVQKAVEDKRISSLRYASYCYLLLSVKQKHVKR